MNSICLNNIAQTQTDFRLGEGEKLTLYGVRADREGFYFEHNAISSDRSLIKKLIEKITRNDVANIHLENVVEDFICEYGLRYC